MSHDEVLTITDVAAIPKLAGRTVYSVAWNGGLAVFKIRAQWRVRRKDIDDGVGHPARAQAAKGGPSKP
jgi:hypothetical protein